MDSTGMIYLIVSIAAAAFIIMMYERIVKGVGDGD